MDNGYSEKWFLRCQDLVDKYHPDLLYFDDASLPLEQYGLDIAAHFYNANTAWHDGDNQAVINAKGLPPEHRAALVEDYERGSSAIIQPAPWQTDTCIGAWHYRKGIKYKSVTMVTQMLANIVSKNGNLMLNIPVSGDGTIDDEEIKFLEGLAKWMDVEKEGSSTRVHGKCTARGQSQKAECSMKAISSTAPETFASRPRARTRFTHISSAGRQTIN